MKVYIVASTYNQGDGESYPIVKGVFWSLEDALDSCKSLDDWMRPTKAKIDKTAGYTESGWHVCGSADYIEELELEDNETLKVLAALVLTFLDGSHYKSQNPYTRPEVRAALEIIAHTQEKTDWLTADPKAILE